MSDTVAILTYLLVNLPLQTISIIGTPKGLENDLFKVDKKRKILDKFDEIVRKEESRFAKRVFGEILES